MRAFHENPDSIINELICIKFKAYITKKSYAFSSAEIFEVSATNTEDPDQTVPTGAIWSGSTRLASLLILTNKQTFLDVVISLGF